MLDKLSTSLLLPAELADTTNRYRQTLVAEGILAGSVDDTANTEPFIETIFSLLDEDQKQLGAALTAVRQNQLVTQLAEADAIRDDLFIGFRDMVDAGKRRRQEAMQEAWQLVWPVIKSAGTRLYALGYAAQSGRMEALIEQLDQAAYQSAIATLQAQAIYDEMKQAQSNFAAIYDKRLTKDVTQQYPTLRDAKVPLVKHLNGLLEAIDILGETEPDKYGGVIEKMNVITNDIMVIAKARKTRGLDNGPGEIPTDEAPVVDHLASA